MGLAITDFTRNLNELARNGKLGRAFCRTKEVQRTTQILLRRRKNNPVLLGEAGVGKTAIVEEIAHLIEEGKIHHDLSDCEILELDTNALCAGTNKRGEYEERANFLVEHFRQNENQILMIDEIHTIMNSSIGDSNGTLGLNDILKPALARGEICCIGATTLDEYNIIRNNDAALDRRFMPVNVDEPDMETTLKILYSVKGDYEKYHNCVYDGSSLSEMVKIANRYFHYRQFPDKAIDLMDEIGSDFAMRKKERNKSIVTKNDVLRFVEKALKIPVSDITNDTKKKFMNVKEGLQAQIIGQDEAVQRVVKCVMRKECGMYSDKRPLASFLFYGKTGVGKTQLAKTLSELYHYNTIKLDMSEYMEPHAVSSLIGSPPGYIGYQEGGTLTNGIKKSPYSVVIFDEIEKAHPQIYNILLQIMEDGILTDNFGRRYSFKNAIIIMTSNAGSSSLEKSTIGFIRNTDSEIDNSHSALLGYFRPEFLNRIDEIVRFNKLSQEDLKRITKKNITEKLAYAKDKGYDVPVEDLDSLVEEIVSMSDGPRSIRANIDKHVIDPFIEEVVKV